MSARLTDAERDALTKALAAAPGCWDYEPCCWSSAEAMFAAVERILAARLAEAEAERDEAVRQMLAQVMAHGEPADGDAEVLAKVIASFFQIGAGAVTAPRHLAEQIIANGFGVVREVAAERDEAVRQMVAQVVAARSRAEEANTELADLRARVEALADEWAERADEQVCDGDTTESEHTRRHADDLRALVAQQRDGGAS